MMKIHFHTNLDEAQRDVSRLNGKIEGKSSVGIPREGEYVVFPFMRWSHDEKNEREYSFNLEVYSVTYNYFNSVVIVELHIPRIPSRSIADWTEWFRKFRMGKIY